MLTVWQEVGTRRDTASVRNLKPRRVRIRVRDVDAIAVDALVGVARLEAQAVSVEAPIGLCVLTAVADHPQVCEVMLVFLDQVIDEYSAKDR